MQCKWLFDKVVPISWWDFQCTVLWCSKMRKFGNFAKGFTYFGRLWMPESVQTEVFQNFWKRCRIWFANINLYMWNFNSFLTWFTSGNRKRFKDFTRNLRNVIGWKCSIKFPGISICHRFINILFTNRKNMLFKTWFSCIS